LRTESVARSPSTGRGSAVNGSGQVTSIDGALEEKGEEAEPALIHESESRLGEKDRGVLFCRGAFLELSVANG
jgi:hypothetical protein